MAAQVKTAAASAGEFTTLGGHDLRLGIRLDVMEETSLVSILIGPFSGKKYKK
jgi:hypothetical protein